MKEIRMQIQKKQRGGEKKKTLNRDMEVRPRSVRDGGGKKK